MILNLKPRAVLTADLRGWGTVEGVGRCTVRFSFPSLRASCPGMAKSAAPRHLADFKPESLRGPAGFIRVGQTRAGQWWLLDARDKPFFSKAVNAVNRAGRA